MHSFLQLGERSELTVLLQMIKFLFVRDSLYVCMERWSLSVYSNYLNYVNSNYAWLRMSEPQDALHRTSSRYRNLATSQVCECREQVLVIVWL